MPNTNVNNRIKEFRKSKGLSQDQLAKLTGVSRNTIGSIERGASSPSSKLSQRLCSVLQCSFEDLFCHASYKVHVLPVQVWDDTLEEYIKETEPSKAQKAIYWKTGIGLQDVDGLKPSSHLYEIALQNIEGTISIDVATQRIKSYYEERECRNQIDDNNKEADLVSARITKLLSESAFQLSPFYLLHIHQYLFEGILPMAGKMRDYNISKKEWVLEGNSVIFGPWDCLLETMQYDFEMERNFKYKGLSKEEMLQHIAKFIAGIWQIHPFGEGNTRTIAVFLIQYLKTFGYDITNDTFAKHAWYFRNALVRANYNNWPENVYETTIYLEHFLENLLWNGNHNLKNRTLHISY